jgi:hypothetical protein
MMLAQLCRKYRAAGKFQVSGTVCYGPGDEAPRAVDRWAALRRGAPRIAKM